MKKQTKFVATASAAALLAIGISSIAFAANTGWAEEDGVWYYYDKDGNKAENEWKKSGDDWYWLDGDLAGAMAADALVEDGDDTYYVDENGVMVRNTWVKVPNADWDDEEDLAEYNYYYMQANGKAYKAGDNSKTKFRTIDGKRYAFDEDGKMLYGWVNEDATRASDESDWEEATYYMGSWEDGALKTGWQKINVYDEEENENIDYWFSFKSNGKKRHMDDEDSDSDILEKKLNEKRYGFDHRGVMVYEWVVTDNDTKVTKSAAWKYFSEPEDGARKTRGWFKVIPPTEDTTFGKVHENDTFAKSHSADEEEQWYYADKDGNLAVGEIKKINGQYYGFWPENKKKSAAMLTGLCLLQVDDEGKILDVEEDDMDSECLQDLIDGEYDKKIKKGYSLYYFGNDEDTDGALKTGAVTINLERDIYNLYFTKTGGAESRGRGVNGIDDNKYIYKAGVRLKADADEKYLVVSANGKISDENVVVKKIDSAELREDAEKTDKKNKDGEHVKYVADFDEDYYLINTSGTIIKNKKGAKDENDWYFYVDDRNIKLYTNTKSLKKTELENWKNQDAE